MLTETERALKQRIKELEFENAELEADKAAMQEKILDLEACR